MELSKAFQSIFNASPEYIARAPGRVNLIGEHVDYNEGPVLPMGIDRDVSIAARQSADRIVQLYALDLEESISVDLDKLDEKNSIGGSPLPQWSLYPAGVAWSLQKEGLSVAGIKAAYTSTIPIGAGLSSSAAVEVAFAVLWQILGGWKLDRLKLAQLCQRAENDYVGMPCGLMDQFASACSIEGHALYFDTRSLEWTPAPLPENMNIIVADSNVRHALVSSGYSERRKSCEKAVEILKTYLPEIKTLRDVSPIEFAGFSEYLPKLIRKRTEHIVKEIARVESALRALQRKDYQAFGALMYSSHASMRDLYEISTPEIDILVELTRYLPGCLGARLTGGGFGGCTINLVYEDTTKTFIEELKKGYQEKTGLSAQVYPCKPSQGASIEQL